MTPRERDGGAGIRRLHRTETWILGAVTLCWALAVGLVLAGRSDLIRHDAILENGGLPLTVAIPVFLLIWQLMTGAMMLPSILPVVRIYDRIAAARPRHGASIATFVGAYFAVWSAFAAMALTGDTGIHFLVDRWPWLNAHDEVISGALLIGAGLFQLTPLKERCLTECRSPLQFVWRRLEPGPRGAWRLGAANGLYCLGCCWALMLVMFGVGVGSVSLMAAFGGVMVIEKTWRRAARLVPAVSASMVVMGAIVILAPAWVASLPALP